MNQSHNPEGYNTIMPYLILKGAQDFSVFMQKVFGATETMRVMRDESDIMHAELKVGDSVVMFAGATTQYEVNNAGMFIYVDNADSRYALAIAEGASSIMEPANQEYGRSCGVKDPFGNTWWITSVGK